MSYYTNNSSPPPLQHPVPTHPAYIPEPPTTPLSPPGYQRYTSSPSAPPGYPPHMQGQAHPSHIPPQYAPGAAYQPPHPQMNPGAPVDFSAWGLDNATAAFGMQLGQSAVAAGQEYVQKNVRPLAIPCARSSLTCPPPSSEASSLFPCSSTISMSPIPMSSRSSAFCSSRGDIDPGPVASCASKTASRSGHPRARTSTRQTCTSLVRPATSSSHFSRPATDVEAQSWLSSHTSSLLRFTLDSTPASTPRFSESPPQKRSPSCSLISFSSSRAAICSIFLYATYLTHCPTCYLLNVSM